MEERGLDRTKGPSAVPPDTATHEILFINCLHNNLDKESL